jgi:hypothetical protein
MKNRRMYVAYDVEPVSDPTGGPWYLNGNFDTEFFETLCKAVIGLVQKADPANGVSASEVNELIRKSGVFTVPIEALDISRVMHALMYDGRIELVPSPGQIQYILNRKIPKTVGYPQRHNTRRCDERTLICGTPLRLSVLWLCCGCAAACTERDVSDVASGA